MYRPKIGINYPGTPIDKKIFGGFRYGMMRLPVGIPIGTRLPHGAVPIPYPRIIMRSPMMTMRQDLQDCREKIGKIKDVLKTPNPYNENIEKINSIVN